MYFIPASLPVQSNEFQRPRRSSHGAPLIALPLMSLTHRRHCHVVVRPMSVVQLRTSLMTRRRRHFDTSSSSPSRDRIVAIDAAARRRGRQWHAHLSVLLLPLTRRRLNASLKSYRCRSFVVPLSSCSGCSGRLLYADMSSSSSLSSQGVYAINRGLHSWRLCPPTMIRLYDMMDYINVRPKADE